MYQRSNQLSGPRPKCRSAARLGLLAAVSVAALVVSGTAVASSASTVVSPHGTVAGKGYGFYVGKVWQIKFESRANDLRTCATEVVGGRKVAILVAKLTKSGRFSQTCAEPAGRPIFLAHLSDECSTFKGDHAGYGTSDAQLKNCARAQFKGATGSTTVDGHRLRHLHRYAAASGAVPIQMKKSNYYGFKGKLKGRSAAYGFGVLLHGLSKGTHTVALTGDLPSYKFRIKGTYTIKVT